MVTIISRRRANHCTTLSSKVVHARSSAEAAGPESTGKKATTEPTPPPPHRTVGRRTQAVRIFLFLGMRFMNKALRSSCLA
ncbi:hypothetical protein ZWY2020_022667 [Hordeum vulgare]|nr:hypothetical protein ZWY2020_022667 [Hordeum vulgare]